MNTENKKEAATTIGKKAVAWLTAKGWAPTLAKVTVGAIIGAAFGIAAALGMTSCTTTYSKMADGTVHYSRIITIPDNIIPTK